MLSVVYAECLIFSVILSVIMLGYITFNVVMPSVIMKCAVVVSVVAPILGKYASF